MKTLNILGNRIALFYTTEHGFGVSHTTPVHVYPVRYFGQDKQRALACYRHKEEYLKGKFCLSPSLYVQQSWRGDGKCCTK